jgi:pyridoxal phosphate-dependent aminotransferase EpsN
MNYRPGRIFLSAPHMGGHEKNYVQKAIEDNWVSTAGPNLAGFEHDICQHTNARNAVAVNSGTAALHLALRLLGVNPGDEVLCSTLTFVGSANPILYMGATPVFVESEEETWNMCPTALHGAITARLAAGKQPTAIILTHLYGMPAKVKEIIAVADAFGIPVVEDAAEALGSRYSGHQVGTLGRMGAFSFNGNKIITTSGGASMVPVTRVRLGSRPVTARSSVDLPTPFSPIRAIRRPGWAVRSIPSRTGRSPIETERSVMVRGVSGMRRPSEGEGETRRAWAAGASQVSRGST